MIHMKCREDSQAIILVPDYQESRCKENINEKCFISHRDESDSVSSLGLTGLQLSCLRGCESVKGHTFESKWLLFIPLLHRRALFLKKNIKSSIHTMSTVVPIRFVVASAVHNHPNETEKRRR